MKRTNRTPSQGEATSPDEVMGALDVSSEDWEGMPEAVTAELVRLYDEARGFKAVKYATVET